MQSEQPRRVELPTSFRSVTMAAGIRAAMQRAPDKVALTHGKLQRSFRELSARIECAANATVRDLRLQPGQNAAIVARNCREYIEIVCGLPEAGVAVATVNPRYTTTELAANCDDAEARVIFTDAASAPLVRSTRFRTVQRVIEFGDEYERWLELGTIPVERPAIDEWDVWTIPYTSGTTGQPKGVLLSHRSRAVLGLAAAAEFGCFSSDDRYLAMTGMNHGGGLGFPMAMLLHGGSLDIMERFEPETALRKFKHEGITGVFMVPTHFHQIFALDPQVLERYRRPPLRAIISNAAPLPQAMKEKIVPYFGEQVLFEIYSSTEAGLVSSLRPADQLRKQTCAGLPHAHTEIRILNGDGTECGIDEVGELHSRAPWLFNGYWNRPAETTHAIRSGWVTVGDMARRDADGYLYIVDRKKDMVISGGVNIYPREVEEVLAALPSILEVAVIGVPDEKWGERLRAFVVLNASCVLTLDDLTAFCRDKIAAYKIPKELRIIAALPRNANGKVLKAELRRYD